MSPPPPDPCGTLALEGNDCTWILDGEEVSSASSFSRRVEPGQHQVRRRRGSGEVVDRVLDVVAGERSTWNVDE